MATFVRMPQKGLTEETALLSKWYAAEGDTIKEGQYLFSMETGKAAFEVEAETSGTILKFFASEGDEVPVTKIICVIGNPGESFVLPEDDICGGTAQETPPQRRAELPAGSAPPVSAANLSAASLSAAIPAKENAESANQKAGAHKEKTPSRSAPRISPRARRLALTQGLDYSSLDGSGPNGRILEEDVKAALDAHTAGTPRARTVRSVSHNAAQFTIHAHCDAAELLAWQERWNAAKPQEARTINDLVAFTVSRLLPRFPYMNAHPNETPTLPLSDMSAWGADFFTPVINPPQTGALGLGTIEYRRKKTPAGMADYPALPLSLTVDLQAVDEVQAAALLKALCEGLEHFSLMLLL